MIMRERLYKDAHPLHKVSKKIFLFYFLRENPLAKNRKKKIKKRKKFRAKRKEEGGGSPRTIINARVASPCWRKLVACA